MSARPLLLCGAGGHARACIDVVEQTGEFTIVGLTGVEAEVGTTVLGYPVLGTDHDLPALIARHRFALVAVGHIKTPETRIRLCDAIVRAGGELAAVVSPMAHVSRHASIGAGTIVMHGAIVNAAASIGRNVIVNSHALVEHDCEIADHVHIATGAVLNSGVRVGTGTFIGSASAVRQCITIGERCLIGMGQFVVKDCGDGTRLPAAKP